MDIKNKQDLARYLEVKKAHDDAKFHTSELLKLFNRCLQQGSMATFDGLNFFEVLLRFLKLLAKNFSRCLKFK